MKRLLFPLGGLFSSVSLFAQILPTPWTVTIREPHSSVWESIRAVTDPITGEQRAERHSFVELATSLNYFDETTRQWLPSAQEWQVLPGGIVYQFGRHKIILAHNINDPGAVDLLTPSPDDLRLISNPVAIGAFDPVDGKHLILAEVRDAQGEAVAGAPNEIIFRNCFDKLKCSLLFRVSRAGLEQNFLLEERLPDVRALGFSE